MTTKKQTPLQKALIAIGEEVAGLEVTRVAADEGVNPSTVYKYLKGDVHYESIGKSILARCKKIVDAKKQTA